MKKAKVIRLTESDLHNMVKRAVYNIIKESKSERGDFYDGIAWIKNDEGKYNYINHKGQLISDNWFDAAYDFNDGFGVVMLNDKYNFLNTYGQPISEKWFDGTKRFHEGFGSVSLNGMWNFINGNGEILSKQWFDWVGDFDDGCGEVEIDGKQKFIGSNGEFMIQRKERMY